MSDLQSSALPHGRTALRAQLLAARRAWVAAPTAHLATAALGHRLIEVLEQLEPQCLGLYWPLAGEFNAVAPILAHPFEAPPQWALPHACKSPLRMDYRRWDGQPPTVQDDCGIASSSGVILVPDVVLVPCVGFTREGYRLGYGGGYFDRWLSQHPGVTAIGVAWSVSETHFAVEPHDQALTLVVTDTEIMAP